MTEGPKPGERHPIDQAFYELVVKERDYERVRVDRLERELAEARETIKRLEGHRGPRVRAAFALRQALELEDESLAWNHVQRAYDELRA